MNQDFFTPKGYSLSVWRIFVNTALFNPIETADPMEVELRHQVEEHKYFINQLVPHEISMEEAFTSWSVTVHGPLSSAIDEEGLDREFPEVSEDELFLRVSRHWHNMKKNGTVAVSPREAVLDYGSQFAKTDETKTDYLLKKQFV